MVNLQTGEYAAYASAVFFLLAGLLTSLLGFGYLTDEPAPVSEDFSGGLTNAEYLKDLWNWNREAFPWILVADASLSAALLLSTHSVICLKKCYRRGDGMARNMMSNCFLLGAIVPSMQFLQDLGSTSAGGWISQWPGLDYDGLLALQISWLLALSRSLYLYSLMYVFISAGMFLNAYLCFREAPFKDMLFAGGHAVFGIAAGIVGWVLLALGVSMFFHDLVYVAFAIGNLFWAVGMMPTWLVWMGALLHKRSSQHLAQRLERETKQAAGAVAQLIPPAPAELPAGTFQIELTETDSAGK